MFWLVLILILIYIAALSNAIEEIQFKDPKFFEKYYRSAPEGFFGSKSWKRKYKDYPDDMRPRFPLATSSLAVFTDAHHFFGALNKVCLVAATVLAVLYLKPLVAILAVPMYGVAAHLHFNIFNKKTK